MCELGRCCDKTPPCKGAYLDDCEKCRWEIYEGSEHVCPAHMVAEVSP